MLSSSSLVNLFSANWFLPGEPFNICKEEKSDCILLYCSRACILWLLIFVLFDVQWVMHSSMRWLLLVREAFVLEKEKEKEKKAWKGAPLCLFQSIWRERGNKRIFEKV